MKEKEDEFFDLAAGLVIVVLSGAFIALVTFVARLVVHPSSSFVEDFAQNTLTALIVLQFPKIRRFMIERVRKGAGE